MQQRYSAQLVAAQAARQSAQQQRAQVALTALAAQHAALDTAADTLATAVTPAVTPGGARAAAAQAPVVSMLATAGAGYPTGYRRTGQVLTGEASWYGPGFVGSPTASGAPYNPELFTAAMLTVPLGTVVRVSANGRAVSVLVTDRGPYAQGRVLDCSRACSRALGYDGVAQVSIEVLARG